MPHIPNDTLINQAVTLLKEAAPKATVILFGSYARGDFSSESDVDFLVIEPVPIAYKQEAVRLRNLLRPLKIPVDVLVTDKNTFDKWADTPGTVYFEIQKQGRIYDS